ncbi:MAG: ETX/MTX2 family pore-forming toxin [Spiroplasma sp.]|nr:ETX/MTX2 family pore-forming toxin [Spiroplasma sp.]
MKKLLSLIFGATLALSPVVSTLDAYQNNDIATHLLLKGETKGIPARLTFDPTNIVTNFDDFLIYFDSFILYDEYLEKGYEHDMSENNNSYINNNYQAFFNNKTGILKALTSELLYSQEIESYHNTYKNNSPNEQTFSTQSFSKTISNSTSFSFKMNQEIELKTSVKIPFISESELNIKLGFEQQWNDTKTDSITRTIPSQQVKVNPHSETTVRYLVKETKYHVKGMASYTVNLNDRIYFLPLIKNGQKFLPSFTIKQIISKLEVDGFGDKIKNTSKEFSVIKTDNPNNPSQVTLNLPVEWEIEGSELDVEFD